MPAVVRIGDTLSTGHGCTGITTLAGANQGSVYVNSILAAVVGAPTAVHSVPPNPPCPPHTANLNSGSSSVYVEGIPLGRVGDSADAGSMLAGSPNVYAGG
jgi:uncharacterized Zn-binding protein involved in type VI secretion